MAITHTNNTEEIQYYVVHSEPRPDCGTCSTAMLLELEPGSSIGTGQPYAEFFDNYEEALQRAIELGYEEPEELIEPEVLPPEI
jgi:hypothetical protein